LQDKLIAYSAQKSVEFSPDQEQPFQNTFEHSHFKEWLKTKLSREHEEMNTEHELLGLEHSMNITHCIIAKDQEPLTSGNILTRCPEITSRVTPAIPPEHEGE